MPKKRISIIITGIILLFGCYSYAIEENSEQTIFKALEIKNGSRITLEDCVLEAFKNSPQIKRKKYQLDLAKANVGIAKSQYFPVISAGVGLYNENNSTSSSYFYSHYKNFPSVAASINQLVWNFGKTTAYIKMEDFYRIGAEYEFTDSVCSVLFDVKTKYYELLLAKAMVYIAEYNKKINEYFVKISEDRNKYESETAKINLCDAEIKLLDALNDYRNGIINLSNSMYLENIPDFSITHTPTFHFDDDFFENPDQLSSKPFEPKTFDFDMNKAIDIAYANSPELNVLTATKNAMEQSLKYVKKTYMPDLTADMGYTFDKINSETGNNGLRVGVNLTSKVNLMELKHGIKAAQAQIDIADNEITLYKKDLFFEVKRALNNVEKSQRQIPIAKSYIDEGLNNLRLIEKQYLAKNIDYTSLQDARKDYIQLLQNYADSIYNYNIALIQLEEATHYHMVDIHSKSNHAITHHFQEIIDSFGSAISCDKKCIKKSEKKKKTSVEQL